MSGFDADLRGPAAVVEAYVEACRLGDADRLAAIFHPCAHMFGRVGRTEVASPIGAFIDHVRASPPASAGDPPYRASLRQIQVVGDTAVVTLEEQNYQGRDYIDQFALARSAEGWRIVTKVFSRTS